MNVEKDLAFPLSEYKDRLVRLREKMIERGLDVAMINSPENMFYLSGYETPGYYAYQALVLPREAEPVMVVRLLEETNVLCYSWIEKRATYKDTEDPVDTTCRVLRELGAEKATIGLSLIHI